MGGVHIFITPVQGSPPHQHASRCLTHREISIQNDTIRTVVNALDQILVVFRELVHTAPPQWNHNTPGGGPQGLFFRAQSRKKRVLLSTSLFAGRDDFPAPKSEGRKSIAQCASTVRQHCAPALGTARRTR